MDKTEFIINERYPIKAIDSTGMNFIDDNMTLNLAMSGLTHDIIQEFAKTDMYAGLLYRNGDMMIVWQFVYDKRSVLLFGSPLDNNYNCDMAISDDGIMSINVHLVDMDTFILKGIRTVIMPSMFVNTFIQYKDMQQETPGDGRHISAWLKEDVNYLAELANMQLCIKPYILPKLGG